MSLKNPTHPGEHILYDCLEPLGQSAQALWLWASVAGS